jgi:isopentenyl-diphosphate delta-isomerase
VEAMREDVVLVDLANRRLGVEGKIKAHQQGHLHRAFSIFIFNSRGRVLLQKRSPLKYHTPGLWSNTVCGHPQPNERLMSAAHRRLGEEMGFDCRLSKLFSFVYRAEFENRLTEFEHDTVFIGFYDEEPHPNLAEVAAYRWERFDRLPAQIQRRPDEYTVWLRICMRDMRKMNGPLRQLRDSNPRHA